MIEPPTPTSRPAGRGLGRGLLPAGLALAAGLALFGAFAGHGFDDPYITYRYAANLAAGHGLVYNPGEAVLSTTAPLYALLLAPAAALGLELPLLSNLISCLSLAAGGLALWRLGLAWGEPLAGLAAGLIYPGFPLLVATMGGEAALLLALLLWAFAAAAEGRWRGAALLLGLATLTRADAALAGLVIGLALLAGRGWPPWRRPGELPWGAAAIYLALVLPWLAIAQISYGSPFPVTLAAKRRQALIEGSRSFAEGLADWLAALWAQPAYATLLALAAAGLAYGLWRRRGALAAPAWGALYALAYSLLGVTAYFWYYAPVFAGLIVAAGLGAAGLAHLARRWLGPRGAAALAAGLAGAILLAEIGGLRSLAARPDPRLALYAEAGAWLRDNTPPDARVGALEVGVLGFVGGRPMVDFAGLIQPEVGEQFGPGRGYLEAARWAAERYRPDYLVLQEAATPLLATTPALAARCAPAAEWPDPRYDQPLRVYACRWR